VRTTCLRHEEAPCDGEDRIREWIVAASRTQRHSEAEAHTNRRTLSTCSMKKEQTHLAL
jgi:hypothetical protein